MKEQNHRTTSRVLDIFELLALSEQGLTLTELSIKLDAPKSSIFPIIHTMEERQFVQCDSVTNKFRIGHKAYLTGDTFESDKPIFEYIKCQMKEVADSCNYTRMDLKSIQIIRSPALTNCMNSFKKRRKRDSPLSSHRRENKPSTGESEKSQEKHRAVFEKVQYYKRMGNCINVS